MAIELKTYTQVDLQRLHQLERSTTVYEIVGERLKEHPEERREVKYINEAGPQSSYPINARFHFGVWIARKSLIADLADRDCIEASIIAIKRGITEARRVLP